MRQTLASIGESIQERGAALLESVLGSALSLINIVVLLVVVPVVAVYLLLDWDRMIARIDALLAARPCGRDPPPCRARSTRRWPASSAAWARSA